MDLVLLNAMLNNHYQAKMLSNLKNFEPLVSIADLVFPRQVKVHLVAHI